MGELDELSVRLKAIASASSILSIDVSIVLKPGWKAITIHRAPCECFFIRFVFPPAHNRANRAANSHGRAMPAEADAAEVAARNRCEQNVFKCIESSPLIQMLMAAMNASAW